jgi:medium-chain acyl-[acyl-carrier-protein] hydrolase
MPLTQSELEDIQADALADDIDIDLRKMSLWTREEAVAYFESGGLEEPVPEATAGFTNCSDDGVETRATPWLSCVEKKPDAKFRLVCFSWTGNRGGQGSAHNLRRVPLNWSNELAEAEVYEVCLPGRGMRSKESLATNAHALATELSRALAEALHGGKPYAFVGFAFGSILAWEVARGISSASNGAEGPAVLVVVSAEGPAWAGRGGGGGQQQLHATSDDEFRSVLADKGGTDFILRDEGMSRMYLPVIRADLSLEETYRYGNKADGGLSGGGGSGEADGGRLCAVPTIALVGAREGRDKEKSFVCPEDASLWLKATSSKKRSKVIELKDCDWYVLQEPAGVRAVLGEVASFMSQL